MSVRPRLIALDADDLAVVSAQVQDALVNVADVIWRQDEKRLVVGLLRLDRDRAMENNGKPQRLASALRFERVLTCKSRDIDLASRAAALSVLGIAFHANDPPGGSAMLMFAGGGVLRLDVECLECELTDLGDAVGAGDMDEITHV